MSENYDTIVFDLDGTLADTIPDVAFCINHALNRMGFLPISLERVKQAIGPGRDEFIRAIFPNEGEPDSKTFLALFREIYWERCVEETRLFEGVKEVLEAFEDLRFGVASNKPKIFSERILQGLGIRDRFAEVIGPEDVIHAKPHPEMILKILDRMKGSPLKTLFIGDTDKDILAGQNAGVRVCGVRYGYGKVEDIEQLTPDFLIDRPMELIEIIHNHDRVSGLKNASQ